MGQVFHRDPGHKYPVATGSDGVYVVDKHGRRYLDAGSGGGAPCLGYGDREVVDAIAGQLGTLASVDPWLFSNKPMEGLSCELIDGAPEGLARVVFCSNGPQAVTAALDLARQFFVERGEPHRRHIIARRQSARGDAPAVQRWRRDDPMPPSGEMSMVSPCYAYRGMHGGEDPAGYGQRLVRELDDELCRVGPANVAAFVAETVGGVALGCAAPVPGYWRGVREVCDRYGVLLILDETMCGMGRCGTRYTSEAEGIRPDLLALGAGLGGGYHTIGALLVSGQIYDGVVAGSGSFRHADADAGHAAACAGALAVQRAIRQRNLLAQVQERALALQQRLQTRFSAHPHVGDIRGRGLFRALELVADRAAKRPFDAHGRLHARLERQAMANGLIVRAVGGCVDGVAGDHVVLAPPYVVTDAQLDEMVDLVGLSIDQAIAATQV